MATSEHGTLPGSLATDLASGAVCAGAGAFTLRAGLPLLTGLLWVLAAISAVLPGVLRRSLARKERELQADMGAHS